ncbi:MAG: UDP-glucose--hexose-1-phosphate uridylyltransferase [Clostridiales bacterium]|jgi:UDPglucose--hexose-1-phosphate uridylyltransferase|nr:UDP-glucose--hexose-1-phosphate uridylyltransferase [Clostridiales bacterium]
MKAETRDQNAVVQYIENLLAYAEGKGLSSAEDRVFLRNSLYDLLSAAPAAEIPSPDLTDEAFPRDLYAILDLCADTAAEKDLLDARVMGLFTPRPSEVNRIFEKNYKISPRAATDAFYVMCQNNHYIQADRLAKNLYWLTKTEFGALEITVNLAKPEKDPRDIAAAKALPQTGYPKCLLCMENVGFAGHLNHPARQNLRAVPVELAGETWYFQYSPYIYYNEHCIVLSPTHTPMSITAATFRGLMEFLKKFPHYIIGSNSDIPIVGGSILSHDHYQGGRHVFPLELAGIYATYRHRSFPRVKASLVKWPMSVIRLESDDSESLITLSTEILENWKNYSDESASVYAYTRTETGNTPHNAITPIARLNKHGLWEMDLVLRNNRTSDEHPLGIFHPHANLHHIKKENIGLIEVMGLAILPGRLKNDMDEMEAYLTGRAAREEAIAEHQPWLDEIKGRLPENADVSAFIKNEIGNVFKRVLLDSGVFKTVPEGNRQFDGFMKQCGFISDY